MIQLSISRSREYQADESGRRAVGRPAGAGLGAAQARGRAPLRVPLLKTPRLETSSHLMIANPFGGVARRCSPPTRRWPTRIARLEELARSDPRFLR